MHAYRPSTRIALLFLATAGWMIAGVVSWLLVRRIGSLGVVLVGLAILFVSYCVSLDEVPDFASGQNPTYKATIRTAVWSREMR